MFALCQAERSIHAEGMVRRLRPGPADTLEERVRAFFADAGSGAEGGSAPAMLVGAIPFDRAQADSLFQPAAVAWHEGLHLPAPAGNAAAPAWVVRSVTDLPRPESYERMVARALDRLGRGADAPIKVVLARALRVEASAPVDPMAIAALLARDRSAATFMVDLSPASGRAGHMLVGATPELLLSRKGAEIRSNPLAGSARRSADAAEDRAAGEALLRSDKDRREHALVVTSIMDLLAPLCAELSAPGGIALQSTAAMWHLGTRIEGRLKSPDGPSAAGLAALLHPTPAVGGYPRAAALGAIEALEERSRGFYAGAVGWTDALGDGEWHVTLRCAEIEGARLTLHAGAGIVAGSDPAAELAETSAKFQTMLRALGLGDEGAARQDCAA